MRKNIVRFLLGCVIAVTITTPVFAGMVFSQEFYDNQGYSSEYDYWNAAAGGTGGSVTDCIDKALSDLGYTGSIADKLYQWASLMSGTTGSLRDVLAQAENVILSGGSFMLLEDGSFLLLENGNIFLL